MARYHEIADDLERRICVDHEWEVGRKIPGISELQRQYETPSLGVIRRAQQILVRKGLLRTEQGAGAFVVSWEPLPERIDALSVLIEIREQLDAVIPALHESPPTAPASDVPRPSADLRPILHQVLRLQQEHTRLDVDWRSAFSAGDTDLASQLDQELRALSARMEQLIVEFDAESGGPAGK